MTISFFQGIAYHVVNRVVSVFHLGNSLKN